MTELLVHRFTAEDYELMAQSGALSPDARVELLDGQIVDMFPIGPFHGSIVGYLIDTLSAANEGRWTSSSQSSLRLDGFSQPQPDYMLLRPRRHRYVKTLPVPEDVFLLIEVADTSLALDKATKVPAYAKAGVLEVWVINVPEKVVEIYRDPAFESYKSVEVIPLGGTFAPQAFPDVVLKTAELFNVD